MFSDMQVTPDEAPAKTTPHQDVVKKARLRKKEAYGLARVARATWDRYRKKKKDGDPAFRDFPNDYRDHPTGQPWFDTAEVVNWLRTRKT